jgi:hypothetical protein
MNCCNNLNRGVGVPSVGERPIERLTDDLPTTVTVSTSSTTLLTANPNRRIIKIYCLSLTVPSAEVWIRYGTGATLLNSSHPLLFKNLLIVDSAQSANAISAVCSAGTAQLRVSSAERVL